MIFCTCCCCWCRTKNMVSPSHEPEIFTLSRAHNAVKNERKFSKNEKFQNGTYQFKQKSLYLTFENIDHS